MKDKWTRYNAPVATADGKPGRNVSGPVIPDYGTPARRSGAFPVLGFLSLACFVSIFVFGNFVSQGVPDELTIVVLCALPGAGLFLGISGIAQGNHRSVIAWIGTALNAVLLGTFLLVKLRVMW